VYGFSNDWVVLAQKLQGQLVSAFSDEYVNVTMMHNLRVTTEPYINVMVETVKDV
jgi:hypothetical protein